MPTHVYLPDGPEFKVLFGEEGKGWEGRESHNVIATYVYNKVCLLLV